MVFYHLHLGNGNVPCIKIRQNYTFSHWLQLRKLMLCLQNGSENLMAVINVLSIDLSLTNNLQIENVHDIKKDMYCRTESMQNVPHAIFVRCLQSDKISPCPWSPYFVAVKTIFWVNKIGLTLIDVWSIILITIFTIRCDLGN